MKRKLLSMAASIICLFQIMGALESQAEQFGIHFLGNTTDPVTGVAGVLPMTNWNNIANATFTTGPIRSSDNSLTAMLRLSGAASRTWRSGAVSDGGNGSLMNGYMDLGNNLNVGSAYTATNVVSGLTGSLYNVFLYVQADAKRPGNATDRLPNYTVNGTRVYAATLGGKAFNGFIEVQTTFANSTAYPPGLTYGNYIEMNDVIPVNGAITILAEGDTSSYRSPLNGIQICSSAGFPRVRAQPASLTLYTGQTAQFAVTVKSSIPASYQWRKNGINLAELGAVRGTTTSQLALRNLMLMDKGDYDVVVANSYGSVTSQVARLEVVVETIADTAIDSFNAAYLIQTNGLTYYATSLTNRAPDGTWTMCLNIQGEMDAFERTQSPQHRQLVHSLLTTFLIQTPPPWSWDGWNDDIGWFCLALIRGYQITNNPSFLSAAAYGYNYAYDRGWDTNYNNGGIWEQNPEYMPGKEPNKDPLANDSLAQVACMLYQSTSNTVYLTQAQQIYSWVRTNVYNPNTGQVYSRIHTNGTVDTGSALYNQGTFVDLANLLYQITGQQMYFDDALRAVEYTRNNLTSNGIFNSNASWLNTWAAEFARGLGHFVKDNNLWSIYYPWMQANANTAWANRRPDLNLTWNEWTKPTPTNTDLITNGLIANWPVSAVAMMQMTPATEPGFTICTNQLSGTVIGTSGSWNNSGNTIAKVFDKNLGTFFDAPHNSGDWVGLDFGYGISNTIGQINYYPRAGYANRMLSGVFQGANDLAFSNPTTLCTVGTTPLENNAYTFQPVTNRTRFRYVRYVGPVNSACNVAEIQFFTINPPPPQPLITNGWKNGQLTMTWRGEATLLEATNVSGPWITNFSAYSTFTIIPGTTQKYFRLRVQ